jgi:hypothetical protein
MIEVDSLRASAVPRGSSKECSCDPQTTHDLESEPEYGSVGYQNQHHVQLWCGEIYSDTRTVLRGAVVYNVLPPDLTLNDSNKINFTIQSYSRSTSQALNNGSVRGKPSVQIETIFLPHTLRVLALLLNLWSKIMSETLGGRN